MRTTLPGEIGNDESRVSYIRHDFPVKAYGDFAARMWPLNPLRVKPPRHSAANVAYRTRSLIAMAVYFLRRLPLYEERSNHK